MAKYVIEDTTLTALANSVRSAEGSTDQMTPDEMAVRVGDIGDIMSRLVSRTITDADLAKILSTLKGKSIPRRSFSHCTAITSVYFPENLGFQIEAYAFDNATNLKTVDFGNWKLTNISGTGFQNTAIEELDIPETVSVAAFNSMTKLKKIRFYGNALYALGTAFYGCSSIELIDFSNYTRDSLPSVEKPTQAAPNATCKILVKPNIIRTAKQQTNWSAKKDQIVCSLGEGYTVTISSDLPVNEGAEIYINGIAHPLRAGDVYNGVHCVGVEGTVGLGGYYQNEWNDSFSITPSSGDELIWDNIILTDNYSFG